MNRIASPVGRTKRQARLRAVVVLAVAITGLTVAAQAQATELMQLSPRGGAGGDVFTDSSGRAHLVWNELGSAGEPDPVRYCQIDPGEHACSSNSRSITPSGGSGVAGTYGDVPKLLPQSLNGQDFTVYSSRGGGMPSGSSTAITTWAFGTTNAGGSFAARVAGGNPSGGPANGGVSFGLTSGAITIGGPNASVQQVDDSGPQRVDYATLGRSGYGGGLTLHSSIGFDISQFESGGVDAVRFIAAYSNGSTVRYRRLRPIVASPSIFDNWSTETEIGSAKLPVLASNQLASSESQSFLTLVYYDTALHKVASRKFDPESNTFGVANPISDAGPVTNLDATQDPSGRVHAVWRRGDNEIGYATSDDGVTWSSPVALTTEDVSSVYGMEVSVNATGHGFVALYSGLYIQPVWMLPIAPEPDVVDPPDDPPVEDTGHTPGGAPPSGGVLPGGISESSRGPSSGAGTNRPMQTNAETGLNSDTQVASRSSVGGSTLDLLTPTRSCVAAGHVAVALKVKAKRKQVKGKANKRQKLSVKQVWFYVDQQAQIKDKKAPFSAKLDVRLTPGSTHTLRSQVFYALGKSKKQKSKNITRQFKICS